MGVPGGSATRLAVGAVLSAAVLAWSRRLGLSLADIGLRRDGAIAGTAGAVLGIAGAALGLLVLRYQPLGPGAITYAPARALSPEMLALHVLVFLPLGVALPEELAFRGVLLASLSRKTTLIRAIAGSSLAFALWHATIVLPTVRETNLADDPILVGLAIAGAGLVLFAGGVALAVLRVRSRTLAAPFAAHWAFNAAMLAGLARAAA